MNTYLPAVAAYAPASERVTQFARLWLAELGERTRLMRQDARLMAAASDHAHYLASREDMQVSLHVGSGNSTANERVRASGYKLPASYGKGNNVESCAVNHGSVADALQRLLQSPAHRAHLMGEPGFSDRTVWGVGNAGPFWVVLACPPEEMI